MYQNKRVGSILTCGCNRGVIGVVTNDKPMFTEWDGLVRRIEEGFDDVSAIIAAVEELLISMYCRDVGAKDRIDVERQRGVFQALLERVKNVHTHAQITEEGKRLWQSTDIVLLNEREVVREACEALRDLCSPVRNTTLYRLVILLETLTWDLL